MFINQNKNKKSLKWQVQAARQAVKSRTGCLKETIFRNHF